MDPFTIAAIGFKLFSAGAEVEAGVRKEDERKLTAFRIGTDDAMNQTRALQESQSRWDDYNSATSANIAQFNVTRDIGADQSVRAALEADKAIAARDVSRIDQQKMFQTQKANTMAMQERVLGKNERRASLVRAVSKVGEAVSMYGMAT